MFTYYAYLYDGDGGEALCYTKDFKADRNKTPLLVFDKWESFVEYLMLNDEKCMEIGRDYAWSYVLDLKRRLEEKEDA